MHKHIPILLTLLLTQATAYSQWYMDTTELPAIEITATRIQQSNTGYHIQEIDSTYIKRYASSSINELLSGSSAIAINSYSPGGLSTSAMRGTRANHTAILWNGINLQSPSSGEVNLSCIPVYFIEDLQIQHGGAATMYGSGALGGAIHINTMPQHITGINVSASAIEGSYGFNHQGVNVLMGNKKHTTGIKVFHNSSENNYSFLNRSKIDEPRQQQTNSAYKRLGIMGSSSYIINAKQELNTNIWYQNMFSEIPPDITNTYNKEQETNQFIRISNDWQYKEKNKLFIFRNAYLHDNLLYENESNNTATHNQTRKFVTEIEGNVSLHTYHFIKSGLNHTYEKGLSEFFGAPHSRDKWALLSSYKLNKTKTQVQLNYRHELIDGTITPPTYSLGINYALFKFLSLKGNLSKNYRTPTFNELYWGAWGNPNLKPELGFNHELSFELNKPVKHSIYSLSATGYYNNINNGIIWMPKGSIWQPENFYKLNNKGFDAFLSYHLISNASNISAQVNYSYNISVNNDSKDKFYNKIIPYTPMHKGNFSVAYNYKTYNITYTYQYNGKRFTQKDNLDFLKSYSLSNIYIAKRINLKNIKLNIFMQVNNVFNKSYEMIAWYAMPMRNFKTGIQVNFNKPSKKIK